MRLICPNCDAQYEVSDDVIPTEGRDVQCSNCGQTWFQHHPDHMPEVQEAEAPAPDLLDPLDMPEEDEERVEFAPPPPPPPAPQEDETSPPQRRPLDEGVADILRQEAELEQQARASQAIETQPDLGLDNTETETERRAREARERMARLRGEDPRPAEAAATAAAIGSRRELLPDIDEINSTLRASDSRNTRPAENDETAGAPIRNPKRSGFRSGFLLMVVLAIGLGVLYVFAPQIAQSVPQTDPYITNFVALVDQARGWLDAQVESGLSWLDSVAGDEG